MRRRTRRCTATGAVFCFRATSRQHQGGRGPVPIHKGSERGCEIAPRESGLTSLGCRRTRTVRQPVQEATQTGRRGRKDHRRGWAAVAPLPGGRDMRGKVLANVLAVCYAGAKPPLEQAACDARRGWINTGSPTEDVLVDTTRREQILAAAQLLGPEKFNGLVGSVGQVRALGRLRYWQEDLIAKLSGTGEPVILGASEFIAIFDGAQLLPEPPRVVTGETGREMSENRRNSAGTFNCPKCGGSCNSVLTEKQGGETVDVYECSSCEAEGYAFRAKYTFAVGASGVPSTCQPVERSFFPD